jgi:hypothetical protein
MIITSYIITAAFFALVQIIQNMHKGESRIKNLFLTLLFPFIGYPKNKYELKGKENKQTVYYNNALVSFIFWLAFFFLPMDFLMDFAGGNYDGSSYEGIIVGGGMDVIEGCFVGLFNLFTMIIIFFVAMLTIMVPLIMAAFAKK